MSAVRTHPTGGTVSYEYGDSIPTAGTYYKVLKKRTTSDGAVYEFDHIDNGDDTFVRRIKMPSAWLDYTYGEPVRPSSTAVIKNHKIDSGRLINFSRSEPGGSWWTGKKLLSVDYQYKNLDTHTNNQVDQVVVPEVVTTRMNFDSSGNAQSVFTKNSSQFDEWGFPSIVKDESASTSIYGVNSHTGVYAYQSDDVATSEIYSKIAIGKIKSINRPGDIQSFIYNDQGDVNSHTVNGITKTYQWSKDGNLEHEKTALGHTTSYSNYKRGQTQHITDPSGYSKNRIVNDNSSLASETRFTENLSTYSGVQGTRYEYDALRRLSKVIPERVSTYDTTHNWTTNTRRFTEGGRYIRIGWHDEFGRPRVENHYDRGSVQWTTVVSQYDSEGRLSSVSYPVRQYYSLSSAPSNLPGIHYTYDALSRITQVKYDEESGNDTTINNVYSADSTGQLTIKETNGRGYSKTTSYRAYGTPHYQWPIRIIEANGQTTNIERFGTNGIVTTFNRGGQSMIYDYNQQRQLTSVKKNENGTTNFTYYADGRLRTRTNNGQSVSYQYYANGQLHKELFSDPSKENVTREYRYDRYQNLEYAITTSDSGSQNNRLFYTYDAGNNVTGLTLIIDDQSFELGFEYDELSKLYKVTYPNGRVYSLSPTSLGNPTAIQEIGGSGKTIYDVIAYNPNQSMKLMQRNGHQVENELNRGLRCCAPRSNHTLSQFIRHSIWHYIRPIPTLTS